MKKLLAIWMVCGSLAALSGCESVPPNADVKITTDEGVIYVDLYDDTPEHKANFIKLAKEGFFDGTTFHRCIREFMIQGGDPNTKDNSGPAGMGGPGYNLKREILPNHYHKAGALAAARQGDASNPNWESSGSQFYIVTGKVWTDAELDQMEQQIGMTLDSYASTQWQADPKNGWVRTVDLQALQQSNPDSFAIVDARIKQEYGDYRKQWPKVKFTPEMRTDYKTKGGTPFLDGTYTVFGEVVGGLETAMKIVNVKADANGKPLEDIKMTVEVLK